MFLLRFHLQQYMKNFEQYKQIKSIFATQYRGYDIEKILAHDVICIVFEIKFNIIKDFIKAFCARNIIFSNIKHRFVASIGPYKRNEYREIIDYAIRGIAHDFIDLNKSRFSPFFSFGNLFFSIKTCFFNKIGLSVKEKACLAFRMTHYMNTIDLIEQRECPVPKVYCSLCSTLSYEGILDRYFSKRGASTYTLQHGIYVPFKKPVLDMVLYENMVSDHILCWGEFTRHNLIKYGIPKEKIIVGGYPHPTSSLRPHSYHSSSPTFLVLLARLTYDENNIELLRLINSLKERFLPGARILVKTHPSLDMVKYKNLCGSHGFELILDKKINEIFHNPQFDFSIAYNTTAYFESYAHNRISFHFLDQDIEHDAFVMDDAFSSVDELYAKIINFSGLVDKSHFWQGVEERMKYLMGFGINNYAKELLSYSETDSNIIGN